LLTFLLTCLLTCLIWIWIRARRADALATGAVWQARVHAATSSLLIFAHGEAGIFSHVMTG
jgi:hypothetical protein